MPFTRTDDEVTYGEAVDAAREAARKPRAPRPPRLTVTERAALDAIRWLAVRNGWVRAKEIAARTGQSPEGAAQTCSSLIRKGLVKRATGRGHVWFQLSQRGWDLATPRTKQAQRAYDAERRP